MHSKMNKTIKFEPTWDWLEPSLESLKRIHVKHDSEGGGGSVAKFGNCKLELLMLVGPIGYYSTCKV